MTTKFKTTLKLLAGAACLLSAHTFAVPISNFDFTAGGGFVDGSATCDGGGTCGITYSNADAMSGDFLNINWGTPANTNPSGLEIQHDPFALGSIQVGAGPQVVGSFSHSNFVLQAAGGWMNFVQVSGIFNLFDPDTNMIAPTPIEQINNLAFYETLNSTPCDDPFPGGNATDCDDVFTTEILAGAFDFTIDGYIYTFSFGFQAGPGLTGFIFDTWDFGDGEVDVIRIWTQEDGVSTIYTTATIDVRPVPEPGTLALFGLSLLGMGAYARRRKQS